MKYIDLHTHTIYSDGTNQPSQNVIDCAVVGVDVMAITDHDTTRGYNEAKEEAKKWGIKVIPGVEVSTLDYHILGYDFDVENKELQDNLQSSRQFQENITSQRIEKLNSIGVPITFDKLKQYFPESRLGKYNIVLTMVRDAECREYLGDQSSQQFFRTYLGKGSIAHKIDDSNQLEPKQVIDMLHSAGGIAVVAHPFKDVDKPEDLDELVKLGLDGLEIQPNFKEKNNGFREYAQEKGLILTYGSDFHGSSFMTRSLIERNGNLAEKFWK